MADIAFCRVFFGRAHRGRTGEKLPFSCFIIICKVNNYTVLKKDSVQSRMFCGILFSLFFCEYTAGSGDIADFGLLRRLIQPPAFGFPRVAYYRCRAAIGILCAMPSYRRLSPLRGGLSQGAFYA